MKTVIDWSGYAKVMLLLTVLYYLVIGVRFFKYEILRLFGIKKVAGNNAFVTPDPKEPVEG